MSRLYVITGFLGAGKTTFLKQFARLFPDQRLAVLVNEFGKEDIDGVLLREVHARLAEIHNGSIFCACRLEQFVDTLAQLAEDEPDVILVETSGLSDPTNVRRLLSDRERFRGIQYMGCVCLADACHFEKVAVTARVCRKQLDNCDVVILNKTDLVGEEQRQRVIEQIHAWRPDVPIFSTVRGKVEPEWLPVLRQPEATELPAGIQTRDVSLVSRRVVLQESCPYERLLAFLQEIAPAAYRIKGFVRLCGQTYLVNVVAEDVQVMPWHGETTAVNHLVVLSGQNLPITAALKQAVQTYAPYIVAIE